MSREIKRIIGVENEFGTIGLKEDKLLELGVFISNGGRVYDDQDHIEYATPETTNPRDAVIFEKAGELICQGLAKKLYKNNLDSEGVTYGTHENYFTNASWSSLKSIIPFLVSRQIYTGAGWLRDDGVYEISQRSHLLEHGISSATTHERAILCTKDDPLSDLKGWKRLHLILGDANMCEVADFLKLGTTSLVLALAEDGKLPSVGYDLNNDYNSVDDVRAISINRNHRVKCAGNKDPVVLQRKYLKEAKKHYARANRVTDRVLNLWEDTLDKLASDPRELFGRVDWVTKKEIIDSYAQRYGLKMVDKRMRNIDLQYHDVNRDTSLFYALQKAGKTERIASDKQIERAASNPPKDTRAYFRGKFVEKYEPLEECVYWNYVNTHIHNFDTPDPFNTYKELLKEARENEREAAKDSF